MTDDKVRLHKFMAHCGVTSRRKAEDFIREGRVEVNGATITDMGFKVGPEDRVVVDGKPLRAPKLYYVLMNKPKGVVTTLSDPQKRQTVAHLLPDLGVTLKPVGRLDMDTEGLLLFTNDGDFAFQMTHPRHGVEKEYVATVRGQLSAKTLKDLTNGVFIEGRRTAPAKVEVSRFDSKSGQSTLRVIIHEGRNRQVRLMCETVGHPVTALRRVRIGHLVLRDMAPGMCKTLGRVDVEKLLASVGGGTVKQETMPRKSARPHPKSRPPRTKQRSQRV